MRIAFFGPPGAGKGTQAARLVSAWSLHSISTGSLIRHAIDRETELGVLARGYVSQGKLVPDELVRQLAESELDSTGLDRFILDGYPRTIQQAEWLDEFLDARSASLEVAVCLRVPDEKIIDRLQHRRIHRLTGRTYHLVYDPPPLGIDPRLVVQRSDDQPDAIQSRLVSYRRDTEPVEQYYASHGILLEIDGDGPMNDVFERMLEALKGYVKQSGSKNVKA